MNQDLSEFGDPVGNTICYSLYKSFFVKCNLAKMKNSFDPKALSSKFDHLLCMKQL